MRRIEIGDLVYYIIIIISAFLFALQFLFQSAYQSHSGNSWNASLKFSLYTSAFGVVPLIIINGFKIEFSVFSLWVSFIYALVYMLLNYASIKAFIYANLSVYSVFSMIGGMILPYTFGLLWGEAFKLGGLICCILIILSIILSATNGNNSKKAIKYYFAVFFLNGMIGVVSKIHQGFPNLCTDSGSFMIYTKIWSLLMSVVLLLFSKDKSLSVNKKGLGCSFLFAVATSVGNLLLLIALLKLPASVQYPVVTGGVIVFSTLISLAKGEKLTGKAIISALIAFIATAFMVL